jgi:single-strand DNA-binding protein
MMNSLNIVALEGNMVNEPELHSTNRDRAVCSFSIAVERFYRLGGELKKETDFFDVSAWDDLADTCARIGHKGRHCRVIGRLRQEKWNGPDGSLRNKVIIIAEKAEFQPGRKNNEKEG